MADLFRDQVERFGVTYKLVLADDERGLFLLLYFPSVGAWLEYPLDPQSASDLSAELFHAAMERGAMPWLPRRPTGS